MLAYYIHCMPGKLMAEVQILTAFSSFRHTEHKQLVIFAQFPAGYPSRILLLELKSKTIPDRLIEGLIKVCEQELQKHIGQQQVGYVCMQCSPIEEAH